MKIRFSIGWLLLAIAMFGMILSGCGSAPVKDITELKQGDEVSIVGQVAASGLVGDDMIWVQAQQSDGSFIIYHCQLKSEFISSGAQLQLLDVVKVKGLFLSKSEFEQANTSTLVTLYDCEFTK